MIKNRGIFFLLPFSLPQGWLEGEGGDDIKWITVWSLCYSLLSWLKVRVGEFRVKFLKVCEWFDEIDKLNIIFNSRKNNITKMSFILNLIKNYHYISLIYHRKNIKMYKWKQYILIKQYL